MLFLPSFIRSTLWLLLNLQCIIYLSVTNVWAASILGCLLSSASPLHWRSSFVSAQSHSCTFILSFFKSVCHAWVSCSPSVNVRTNCRRASEWNAVRLEAAAGKTVTMSSVWPLLWHSSWNVFFLLLWSSGCCWWALPSVSRMIVVNKLSRCVWAELVWLIIESFLYMIAQETLYLPYNCRPWILTVTKV